ncbi:MAG: cupin domain-containing protein [Hyphomicrobiales bacterium]
MLSETLTDGLNRYKVGQKIRNLRLDKKLALTELGAHTGLSTAMLSKIERGQLFPTLPTLLRIALVFGVGLDHFFVERPTKRLVSVSRKAERIRLPDQVKEFPPSYLFESLDFAVTDRRMDAFLATFPPQSKRSKPHHHDGVEFIYVVSGQITIEIDGEDFGLSEGDSIYFDSGAPHSYRREGRAVSTAIVVIAKRQ